MNNPSSILTKLNFFKNLKIRHKIIMLAVIMQIFIFIVGFIGYLFVSNTITDISDMYENQLKPIYLLNESKALSSSNEANLLYSILAGTKDESIQKYIIYMSNNDSKYYNNIRDYSNLNLDDTEKKSLEILEKNYNKYLDARLEIVSLLKSKKPDEALELLLASKGSLGDFQSVLKDLADHKVKVAEELYTQAQQDNKQLIKIIVFILVFAIITSLVLTFIIIRSIIKHLKLSMNSLDTMSQGDFSKPIPEYALEAKDELGDMARSMSRMNKAIKEIISAVMKGSRQVDETADSTLERMSQLNSQTDNISMTIQQLSAGMQETAATTEEMNATSSEIQKLINLIANKAEEGKTSTLEISTKANKFKEQTLESQSYINRQYSSTKNDLNVAIQQSRTVDKISELSNTILQVASQTNLLALNASIEAARAGEHGRGFSVVAGEIKNLSEQVKESVNQIQQVTSTVISSVDNLAMFSTKMLDVVDTTVLNDYNTLIQITDQYNKDAISMNEKFANFSEAAQDLLINSDGILKSINEISITVGEAAIDSQDVTESINQIVQKVTDVQQQMQHNKESIKYLKNIVERFNI